MPGWLPNHVQTGRYNEDSEAIKTNWDKAFPKKPKKKAKKNASKTN